MQHDLAHRPARPILSLRDPGIERMTGELPPGADRDEARRFAASLAQAASRWQIERAQARHSERRALRAVQR